MRYSKNIKPISYLKANAAEVLQSLHETHEPYIITVNGEAKAVLMDIEGYEESQQTLAMLKLVAIGRNEIDAGKSSSAEDVIQRMRKLVDAEK
ncbi:MAG: type II toxin-antitoxin system Phd/YefM family antitoxin [Candidatus Kapabacteria bacterium]|nr:type II toxin-antitoxin system Phd/YefM family antitoxin [Candidatus Kapabacteria bacterium]